MTADYAVLHPLEGTDIPHHHLAGMDPDPHFKIGQILLIVLLVDRGHRQLHRHGAGDRPLRIVFSPNRAPNRTKIASPMNSSMVPPYCFMTLTMVDRYRLRMATTHFGANRSDSDVKPRRSAIIIVTLRFSPPMCRLLGELEQSVDDLVGEIAAEGLANEAVAPFDVARDPLQLGLDLLAVGNVRPGADQLLRLAFVVADDLEGILNPDVVAPPMPEAVFGRPFSVLDQGSQVLVDPRSIFRMETLGPELWISRISHGA